MRATAMGLVLGALVCAAAAPAQRTSALAGMVRDPNGHPIAAATLSVDSQPLRVMTNDSGHFFLGGIPSGRTNFTLAKLGYTAVRFEIDLQPDTTLVVNIPMRPVQNLPAVAVEGERISAKLMMMGFYDRKKVGIGSFIDNDRIERLAAGAIMPSTFLRDVRGVTVRCRAGGRCTVLGPPPSHCPFAIVVNKIYLRGELDEVVTVGEVYAIEVYERRNYVPMDFSIPRGAAGCGVIAIWTKGFADVR